MRFIYAVVALLASAGFAYGFSLQLAGNQVGTDIGGGMLEWNIQMSLVRGGGDPATVGTSLGMGIGATPTGLLTLTGITQHVTEWQSDSFLPTTPYSIGAPDSAGGGGFDSAFTAAGYDMGGYSDTAAVLLYTMTLQAASSSLPIDLHAHVAEIYGPNPNLPFVGGPLETIIRLTPEPTSLMLLLIGGFLGLVRRR